MYAYTCNSLHVFSEGQREHIYKIEQEKRRKRVSERERERLRERERERERERVLEREGESQRERERASTVINNQKLRTKRSRNDP